MVWTADGRPRAATVRAIQFAADMAARRCNGRASAQEFFPTMDAQGGGGDPATAGSHGARRLLAAAHSGEA
eukprot:4443654-Prorocentrum_lima.AAC.1